MNRIKILVVAIASLVISTYQYGMQRYVGPIGESLAFLEEHSARIEADVQFLNAQAACLEVDGRSEDARIVRLRAYEKHLAGHLDISVFDCDWMLNLVRYFDKNPSESVAIMQLLGDTLRRFFIQHEAIENSIHSFLEHNSSPEYRDSFNGKLEDIGSKIGELRGTLIKIIFAFEARLRDPVAADCAYEPERLRAAAASLYVSGSADGSCGEVGSFAERVLQ